MNKALLTKEGLSLLHVAYLLLWWSWCGIFALVRTKEMLTHQLCLGTGSQAYFDGVVTWDGFHSIGETARYCKRKVLGAHGLVESTKQGQIKNWQSRASSRFSDLSQLFKYTVRGRWEPFISRRDKLLSSDLWMFRVEVYSFKGTNWIQTEQTYRRK